MKVTINNIIDFLREEKDIIIFSTDVKVVEDLVYWSFNEENRYYEIKLSWIITKEFYNKLNSDKFKDNVKINILVLEKLLII